MMAKQLLRQSYVTTEPYVGINLIEDLLLRHRFLVVMKQKNFLGILTTADVVEFSHRLVIDCLSELPHVNSDSELEPILNLMKYRHLSVLPVFHANDFIGVITLEDITDYYLFAYRQKLEQQIAEHNRDIKQSNEKLLQEIVEHQKIEDVLKASLKEKETLLQEVHRRLNNNMQLTSTIVAFQVAATGDECVLAVLKEVERRMQTMVLLHERFYKCSNLTTIDVQEYIRDLAYLLISGNDSAPHDISLSLDMEQVPVLIDTAISCGLIVHELIANALKHAFPDGKKGEIRIRLSRKEHHIILQVSDNGVGVPKGFDFRNSSSLGLHIIFTIGEYHLQGSVLFEEINGIMCQVQFKDMSKLPV